LCDPGTGWDGPTGLGTLKGPAAITPPVGAPKIAQSYKIIARSASGSTAAPRCLGVTKPASGKSYLGLELTIGSCNSATRVVNWKPQITLDATTSTRRVYRFGLDLPGPKDLPCLQLNNATTARTAKCFVGFGSRTQLFEFQTAHTIQSLQFGSFLTETIDAAGIPNGRLGAATSASDHAPLGAIAWTLQPVA
jgi:hypothetical protein